MQPVHVVAMLAVARFLMFGVLVGRARAKHGVKAPAISGNEQFERAFLSIDEIARDIRVTRGELGKRSLHAEESM